MTLGENVGLDLHCPHCGGEVTLEFADWVNGAEPVHTTMVCPYCAQDWRAGFPARLLWIAKRHDGDLKH